jgi:hypothetical protein
MMREARQLSKTEWRRFFDEMSTTLPGKAVDITLITPHERVHQSRVWQLHGLTYDPHDDALIISCRQQEHVISRPTEIRVDRDGLRVNSIEIFKTQGESELVRFIEPLLLPEA